MASRRKDRLNLDQTPEPPRSTRVMGGMGILPRRTLADIAAEPRARRRVTGDPISIQGVPDITLRIDASTGAATIRRDDGTTDIDFSGRDSSKDRRARSRGRGFNENLADRADVQGVMATVISDLIEDIEAIRRDRTEWEEAGNKGVELLGTKYEEASTAASAEGTISRTRHPMLLEAVMRSWANSRAELLPAEGPVKVQDDSTPTPGDENADSNDAMSAMSGVAGPSAALNGSVLPQAPLPPQPGTPDRINEAMALQKDLNHYVTVTDREYVGDFSSMLVTRALKGSQFRKIYFDAVKRRPVSRWVRGTDLLISNDCSHISGASVVAERMMTRGNVVMRMMRAGVWREVRLATPSAAQTSSDRTTEEVEGVRQPTLDRRIPYEIYECRVELDDGPLGCDENGNETRIALPYKVTFDLQSRECLEIRRNWKKGDKDFKSRMPYVHYGFVPGIGFYNWGFVHILGNPERAATALLREYIDAEMLASFPGGVIQKSPGTRTNTTQIRPGPGQFEVVDTGGLPIQEFMQAFQYKGASPQIAAVLENIVSNARRVAGTIELPVGEGRSAANIPSVTVMAFVDAISKVPSAVHKDDHAAQQEEFGMLKELLAEFPECLDARHRKGGGRWTKAELRDANLVPAADPNSPSFVHRLMQGAALVQAAGLPQFQGIANQREIWALMLAILGFGDRTRLTNAPQPQGPQQPDPKAMAALMTAQNNKEKNDIARQKLDQDALDTQREAAAQSLDNETRQQELQSEERIEGQRQTTERLRLATEDRRAAIEGQHENARHVLSEGLEHKRHTDTLQQQQQFGLHDETEGGESE